MFNVYNNDCSGFYKKAGCPGLDGKPFVLVKRWGSMDIRPY